MDASEARRWFADRDPRTVDLFRQRLAKATSAVSEYPELAPSYQHGTRRLSLAPFPYHLIYVVTSDEIVVLAVAHAKRRPDYWSARSSN